MNVKEKTTTYALENIVPQSPEQLKQLRLLVEDFVKNIEITPPLQEIEILHQSANFIEQHPDYKLFQKLIAVMINNCAWESIVASIPFEKRLLLMPKCLSNSKNCGAQIDELGLLCKQCGGCRIPDFTEKAELLGYHVIVSEGTGTVAMLLGSGQIECVVGIACLDSFERSFPLTLKQAIPSIAIPLFNSDCKDSEVCEDWINEILPLKNNNQWNGNIDLNKNKLTIDDWFSATYLQKIFRQTDENIKIANEWLLAGGKRWRPLIMLSVYKALTGKDVSENESIAKLAIAIESFHKASLVHDDIADNDQVRYGELTLHEKYNLPIALNTGDLLLSYGYQMIAESGLEVDKIQQLLNVASQGHRDLCLGQGQEFLAQRLNAKLTVNEVINIFSNKTAPAFEVALKFGAIAAGTNPEILSILGNYSKALGIAYQIQDDLEDFNIKQTTNDIDARRPSIVLAILNEKHAEELQLIVDGHKNNGSTVVGAIYKFAKECGAISEAENLLEKYKSEALFSLKNLQLSSVKTLLYRLLYKLIS